MVVMLFTDSPQLPQTRAPSARSPGTEDPPVHTFAWDVALTYCEVGQAGLSGVIHPNERVAVPYTRAA